MRQLLESNLEFLVDSDFIYLPLLFDPDIEKETLTFFLPEEFPKRSGQPEARIILQDKSRHFIKAIGIQSLLDNFQAINPYSYKQLRNDCLKKYRLDSEVDDIFFGEKLKMIFFQIMPHFIKKNRGLKRNKLNDEEILNLVYEKIKVPERYLEEAKAFQDLKPLRGFLKNLEEQKPVIELPETGLYSGQRLRGWLYQAVEAKVLAREHHRIAKALQAREQFRRAKPQHIATLLFIADTGELEVDGFGFTTKNTLKGEYLIYKRTGDYILKDYYARSYLFPDCRVAVSTYTPFRPFVIEKYKHPFLLSHKAGQEICMKDYAPSDDLTAKNIIRMLEEGITAMCYGYDGRRRNGYHSLDKTWVHIPTIDFNEYRI